MRSRALVLLCVAAGLAFGVYARIRYRAVRGIEMAAAPGDHVEEKHKVTPVMLARAENRNLKTAPPFHLAGADGKTYDLAELTASGPIVLVFIKDGCPCSISAETYFNAIHAAYRGRARFFGVIDKDAKTSRRWAAANGVPFPLLCDPKLELAKAYGAENSAYVALINSEGRIDRFWPGYSATMLKELSTGIARLNDLKEESIDASDAPEELYSGCPFEFDRAE